MNKNKQMILPLALISAIGTGAMAADDELGELSIEKNQATLGSASA